MASGDGLPVCWCTFIQSYSGEKDGERKKEGKDGKEEKEGKEGGEVGEGGSGS